jgi:hypothetical protein
MHFLTLTTTALFGATAMAVPTLYERNPASSHGTKEHIAITSYSLRKTNHTIQSLNFQLHGFGAGNVTCQTGPILSLPSETVTCGQSNYRFVLQHLANGTDPNQYDVSIYHQTGVA